MLTKLRVVAVPPLRVSALRIFSFCVNDAMEARVWLPVADDVAWVQAIVIARDDKSVTLRREDADVLPNGSEPEVSISAAEFADLPIVEGAIEAVEDLTQV